MHKTVGNVTYGAGAEATVPDQMTGVALRALTENLRSFLAIAGFMSSGKELLLDFLAIRVHRRVKTMSRDIPLVYSPLLLILCLILSGPALAKLYRYYCFKKR